MGPKGRQGEKGIRGITGIQGKLMSHVYIHVLTSNENATPKHTSIFQGYIECTFSIHISQRISGNFVNSKVRHSIHVITCKLK